MPKNKEYQKHIVSTSKHEVFLHRTSKDLVSKIMKYGLKSGPDLLLTASHQPFDFKDAEQSYQQTHKGSDAVIVVKIPSEIYQRARDKMKREEVLHDEIGYFNTEKELEGLYVHPKYVHGWIDKDANKYISNPYHEKGFEYLSAKKPSELEKEVLKEDKKIVPKKKSKVKLTKYGLPPPPDEINVVP